MKTVTVTVTTTVQVEIHLDTWDENSTIEQVHREGSQRGVKLIQDLCDRHRGLRIIGQPTARAVIVEK